MISFIIPAHNEESTIGRTINALHAASCAAHEPYEIIVVDDASTDATTTAAAHSGAQVFSVQHQQIAATRNAGAARAQGDLLVFVDADTEVPSTIVSAAVQAVRSGAVGGGAKARFDGSIPIYGHMLAWLWRWLQRFENLASGCFFFCTRNAFEAAGRFDETLYAAEDVVLSRRLRQLGRFVILREVVVTSGRSMRSHGAFEVLPLVAGFLVRGPKFFSTRHGLWYGRRRDDPDSRA
jgi:glycosyltransferase involved in cell wall biosynthesis